MTVGFDNIFDQLSALSHFETPNYPPYNIKKVDKENYQLEMALAGFSKDDIEVEAKENTLSVSADAINPLDYKLTSSLGLEYSWGGMAHLRFGSHLGHDTAGITFGAGVEFKGFVLDYAWSDHNILLTTQQISLSYKF